MKNPRMAPFCASTAMALAATAVSALAYAPWVCAQDFQQQPLPNFYAGQVDEVPSGVLETPPRPQIMLVQDSNPRQGQPWDPRNPPRRPLEYGQPEHGQAAGAERRPSNYPGVPMTADDAPADTVQGRSDPQSGKGVYDGLPVDRRQEARPQGPPPRHFPQHAPAKSFADSDGMLHSGVLQNFLSLMKENYELKLQLKIQQVEFDAQQRILKVEQQAKQQQREAERRIGELESKNTGLLQTHQHAQQQAGRQTSEVRREIQELRRQLVEQSREMQRAQQSKAELEHRARALEAQLEQIKTGQKGPLSRGKEISEEREEKRDRERAQKRDRERSDGEDRERSDEGERD